MITIIIYYYNCYDYCLSLFLLLFLTIDSVKKCVFVHPAALYNQQQQKLLWKFPSLPIQVKI